MILLLLAVVIFLGVGAIILVEFVIPFIAAILGGIITLLQPIAIIVGLLASIITAIVAVVGALSGSGDSAESISAVTSMLYSFA